MHTVQSARENLSIIPIGNASLQEDRKSLLQIEELSLNLIKNKFNLLPEIACSPLK